jgi:hypothetical protein
MNLFTLLILVSRRREQRGVGSSCGTPRFSLSWGMLSSTMQAPSAPGRSRARSVSLGSAASVCRVALLSESATPREEGLDLGAFVVVVVFVAK